MYILKIKNKLIQLHQIYMSLVGDITKTINHQIVFIIRSNCFYYMMLSDFDFK